MLHELNSDLEIVTLNCAEALAEYVHFGQKDKQGRPYIEHVMRVAKACRNLSLDQRVAAILHDVVEDHPDKVNRELLASLFGEPVSHLVEILSRLPPVVGLEGGGKWEETYEQYIANIAAHPLAIPIKLADLTDNLDPARGPIPDSLRDRYEKAAIKLLSAYVQGTPYQFLAEQAANAPSTARTVAVAILDSRE